MHQISLEMCFILLVTIFFGAATALYSCNGPIEGVVNDNVIVSHVQKCTISVNATVNGSIFARNGSSLFIYDGATVNGNIRLKSAGEFFCSGKYAPVTINGQIIDSESTGQFLLCGTKVTSQISLHSRDGEVIVGFGSCAPNTIYGSFLVKGGNGDVMISGGDDGNFPMEGKFNSLSVSNRDESGHVNIWQTTVKQNLNLQNVGNIYLLDVIVKGKANMTENTFISLVSVQVFGELFIRGTRMIVTASGVISKTVATVTNNKRGFTFFNSKFNKLRCFGNRGPPKWIRGSAVAVGKGQCKKFE